MTLSRKQIITIILLLALVFSLPVVIFLTRKRQDIRPKALQGLANFQLQLADPNDLTKATIGKNIDVVVFLQLTDKTVKVSGVDFLLLYDKDKLDVGNIVPNVTSVNPSAPFTDAPIVTSGGSFPGEDDKYNFIRVAQISRKADADLPKDTFQIARITFRGRATGGQVIIKFPDDNKYLEVVGTSTNIPLVATSTPGGPTLTPVPTVSPNAGWSGPLSISIFPGSGSMRASNSFIIRNGNALMQGFWRGDTVSDQNGWNRIIPIVNGNPDWNCTTGECAWSGPLSLTAIPGSGFMQSLDDIVLGNTLTQGIWRGDQGWVRTVPINASGNPVWP